MIEIDGIEYEVIEGTPEAPIRLRDADGDYAVIQWGSPTIIELDTPSEGYVARFAPSPSTAIAVPRLSAPGMSFVVPVIPE